MPSRYGDSTTEAPALVLTKEDVWGKFDMETMTLVDQGMVVARGLPKVDGNYFTEAERQRIIAKIPDVCPIWEEVLPYKSVTVVCDAAQREEVESWLAYVHGGGCVDKIKELENGKIAIRSDYMCW